MTWIIKILGDWLWPLVAAAFIALGAMLIIEKLKVSELSGKVAQDIADIATIERNAATAALSFTKQLDAQKQEHDAILTKANDEAAIKVTTAQADAASAVIAGNQLLVRLRARLASDAAASRSAATANITSPGLSAPTSTGGLYAELFGSAVGEAQQYAGIADAALIAGEQCEASYPVDTGFTLKGSLNPK